MTALVGAGLALAALVLFARLPPTPKFLAVLNDAAHAPVFGALALVVLALLRGPVPERWRTVAAFTLAVLGGIGIEWIQGMIGRDAAWSDVRTDALGAACMLGAAAWWRARRTSEVRLGNMDRVSLAVAFLTAAIAMFPVVEAALAYAWRVSTFPVVVQASSPLDLYFIEVRDARLEQRRLPSPWADEAIAPSLLVRASGGAFPGIAHTEPQPDWRGYSRLHADITNPAKEPLQLTLRVHDADHNQDFADRYNRTFEIPARSREVLSVSLAEIEEGPLGRKLDLGNVAGLIVFTLGRQARVDPEFYVTRIWLE